jgi:hypothetical protein
MQKARRQQEAYLTLADMPSWASGLTRNTRILNFSSLNKMLQPKTKQLRKS